MKTKKEIIEELAELEHKQWQEWASSILKDSVITDERSNRWRRLLITDYKDLTEQEKNQDRIWAIRVYNILYGH